MDRASAEPLSRDIRSGITLVSPTIYIYTSGTTGLPKAAVISHTKLWAMSLVHVSMGRTSEEVLYIPLPLYHSAGFLGLTGAVILGSTVALRNKFSVSQFWEDCRKYNATVILYIGETLRYLCNTPKSPNDRNHNVRLAIGNGTRADVWREFIKRFGNITLSEFYGATEGNCSLVNYSGKIGAVGRKAFLHKQMLSPYALIKYDVYREEPIRDSSGFCVEVAKGEPGLMVAEITPRAPFSGYAGDLQQSESKRLHDVFKKGDMYFNTGDMLCVDKDGFVYFHDRVGDTFRWKGENVATTEVADIVTMADCIKEANVYGVSVPELQDAVEEVLPTLTEQGISVYILADSCSVPGINPLLDKISKASDKPLSRDLRANVDIRSTALYIYTSGTTGLPKAAVVTHERVWAACFIQAAVGVTPDDIFYINLPLYHSAGFLIGMAGGIERGMTMVLRRKFSASQFWEDCRKYNVTVMQYIGETLRYLCNTPRKDNDRHHRVKLAIGNGVRTDIWTDFLSRFGDIQIRELYGATEGNVGFINYTSKIGAVGRINFLHKFFFPYALIKFDVEKEEPVRNSKGLCIEASRGETGLLVGKITQRSPFVGYAANKTQTEKKRLRDVLKKGDLFFNTGDLLRIDSENFVYFQDRVGDTFRWKGENVATSEVADILTTVNCILEANVYGVKVEGHEGRIGMAAVTLKEGEDFDCSDAYKQAVTYLPAYARPRFIRIQPCLEMTGTFKMKKVKLVEEGFNPANITDPLYFLDTDKKTYVPLTEEIYTAITSREIKL